MIKGLYSSEASMRPKLVRLEVLANNLANVNTTGFKRDRVFLEMLKESGAAQAEGPGDLEGITMSRYVDFSEGSLSPTGNPFDLALQGRGFFALETPDGVRYTRNGHFKLNGDGVLVTEEGFSVLGTGGRIQIPRQENARHGNVAISELGEVSIDKNVYSRIRVVDFDDTSRLQKDQQSMFIAPAGERVIEGPGKLTQVRQGFLEESNVDGIEEMIAMIELHRNFETDQRIISSQDATIEKSLEVGRV